MAQIDITNPNVDQLEDLILELETAELQIKNRLQQNPGDQMAVANLAINQHNQKIIRRAIARLKEQSA